MAEDHYFPLFWGDFLAATFKWVGPARGLYVQLLATQWTSGALPDDLEALSLAMGYKHSEFMKLWSLMADKFERTPAGLVNRRVEEVRRKNEEIRQTRSENGRAGGLASSQARAKQNSSKSEAKTSANFKQTSSKGEASDPARIEQPYGQPSDPDPIRSGSDPDPILASLATRARGRLSDRERHAAFERFMEAYPPVSITGPQRQAAEKIHANLLLDGEATAEILERNAAEYARMKRALDEKPHHPDTWLRDGHWRGPFQLPVSAEERAKQERAEREAAEFERLKAWASEKGYPGAPTEHDTPATFESRVNTWLATRPVRRSSSAASVSDLMLPAAKARA